MAYSWTLLESHHGADVRNERSQKHECGHVYCNITTQWEEEVWVITGNQEILVRIMNKLMTE